MGKFLAKSNGLELNIHSQIVSKTALQLFNKISNEEIINRYKDIVMFSSLLHDIGKLTINFQKFLKNEVKKPNLKFRHNEIGWAFLSKYLKYDFTDKSMILNIVYWHHGISNQIEKHTDTEILDLLGEDSINNMLEYLIEIIGVENVNYEIEYLDSINTPLFYPKEYETLQYLILCRSIVTTADRISSNLNSLEQVSVTLVDDYFSMEKSVEITKCKYDNTARYDEQKNIVTQTNKTTIIKAPAGFGKTMIGLLWGLQNKKKLIWVTPRNSVAESVYNSVLEESESLFISPSIQLILGGEIEKSNFDSKKMFDADIIITNIDNFLAPSFKNENMDSSSLIFGCDVIFDEYHELVCDAILMSLFVNIMRVRHKLTNSKTLLLSATQINCEFLWDSLNNTTTVLPNKETHYNAIHDKKYLVKTLSERPDITPNTNTLVVKNTISSAQEEKLKGSYSLLLHNEFLKDKKSEDFTFLLEKYGKKSLISENKSNVIGTHILQASLDISFNHLFEDVFSPQSTVQRWGRVDRFGNCIGESVICIIKETPNGDINKKYIASQASIKNLLYSRNLSDAWFDFLLPYNNKRLTLNEVYVIYNNFNKKFIKEIKAYITASHDESKRRLSSVYPIKFDNKKKKSKNVLTAGSNKLRSLNNEIFYVVQHKNGKDWVGPFTKQMLRGFDEEFNEDSKTLNRMFKTMEIIRNSNNELFEYNDIVDDKKYKTIDAIRKMSKKSNTPYIVYDRYYDDELGVVKFK
tara:strand:+ start:9471 stop:11717 length:2247 start_codon:yes stop_codon:yes gene_type:complete